MNDSEFLLELAIQIKKARLKAGKTQAQVYEAIGIHVGRIEQGKHSIHVTTLVNLGNYFKTNPVELIPKKFILND